MQLCEGDLRFEFPNNCSVVKFDDPSSHGLSHCMKAVDFIVELPEVYVFIEVKDPAHPNAHPEKQEKFKTDLTRTKIREVLQVKFRDSFLYRWSTNQLDKPVIFLALITLEEALLVPFQDELKRYLPYFEPGNEPRAWKQPLVQSCLVLNLDSWNRNFPDWPVHRVSAVGSTATGAG